MKSSAVFKSWLVLVLVVACTAAHDSTYTGTPIHAVANRFLARQPDAHDATSSQKKGAKKPSGTNGGTAAPIHPDTRHYKHQDLDEETLRFGFAIAFLVVVLPPAVFICIYAPGECLMAIGVAMILIGGILKSVNSQNPNHQDRPPAHTNPLIYVIVGLIWIAAGVCKKWVQNMARELEEEDANERRQKYSILRKQWEQEDARERRRKEREKRRKSKHKSSRRGQPPQQSYEMVPLNKPKKGKVNIHESDTEDDQNQSIRSLPAILENGYNSSFSEIGYHTDTRYPPSSAYSDMV